MASIRRSDYDITNTVRVSSPQAVLHAVEQLLTSTWPQIVLAPIERAFADHLARAVIQIHAGHE